MEVDCGLRAALLFAYRWIAAVEVEDAIEFYDDAIMFLLLLLTSYESCLVIVIYEISVDIAKIV